MLMSEAIQEFTKWRGLKLTEKTNVRYDRVLRIFCLCMGDQHIENIKIEHIVYHLSEMQRLGWKRNGVNIAAIALRKFFEFYNLQGRPVLNEQLIPLPRKEVNIPRVASEPDYRKLLEAIPDNTNKPHYIRNRALVMMLYDTGARSGEIASLNIDDLDMQKRCALIRTEKSRGRRPIREIFWTEETQRVLERWIAKRKALMSKIQFADPEALFVSISKCPGVNFRGGRLNNRSIAEVMRVYSNRAGLPTVLNAHSLRHGMGRDIVKSGGSTADVANILGHSSPDSSMIYAMMWGDDLRNRHKIVTAMRQERRHEYNRDATISRSRIEHNSQRKDLHNVRGTDTIDL